MPQEFLHIDFCKRIITAVSVILAAHAEQPAITESSSSNSSAAASSADAMEGRVSAANSDRQATLEVAAMKAAHAHSGDGCCP